LAQDEGQRRNTGEMRGLKLIAWNATELASLFSKTVLCCARHSAHVGIIAKKQTIDAGNVSRLSAWTAYERYLVARKRLLNETEARLATIPTDRDSCVEENQPKDNASTLAQSEVGALVSDDDTCQELRGKLSEIRFQCVSILLVETNGAHKKLMEFETNFWNVYHRQVEKGFDVIGMINHYRTYLQNKAILDDVQESIPSVGGVLPAAFLVPPKHPNGSFKYRPDMTASSNVAESRSIWYRVVCVIVDD
jgi:hypothetical protein